MLKKGLLLFILLLISISTPGYSQEQGPEASPQPSPKPYEKDEFPQWLHDLRRAEIIMVGSFPFTIFFAIEIFDIYRFSTNDFDVEYAPWPFKGPEAAGYENDDEKIGIIITAVSLSVCLAIADYIIVRIERGY